jgi:hypothetical protein
MNSGTIDLRRAISGSSNQGDWNFNGIKYPFNLSEQSPYKIEWEGEIPPGSDEVESRISILADQFFGDCIIK